MHGCPEEASASITSSDAAIPQISVTLGSLTPWRTWATTGAFGARCSILPPEINVERAVCDLLSLNEDRARVSSGFPRPRWRSPRLEGHDAATFLEDQPIREHS